MLWKENIHNIVLFERNKSKVLLKNPECIQCVILTTLLLNMYAIHPRLQNCILAFSDFKGFKKCFLQYEGGKKNLELIICILSNSIVKVFSTQGK